MDEKSKPPLHSPPPPTNPLSQWRGGGRGVTRAYEGTKIRVAIFFFPSLSLLSMNQLVVMVCTHARVCAHVCTLRGGHVHYLFISPVCQAATLCISACLAIIMPHALFNAHAHAPTLMQIATRAIYLGYAHLSPCLLLAPTVANDCTSPSFAYTFVGSSSGHTPHLHGFRKAVIHRFLLSYNVHTHSCSWSPSAPARGVCICWLVA